MPQSVADALPARRRDRPPAPRREWSAPSADALAVWFAGTYRERLRYVAAWKRWMEWDGRRWRADATLLATDLARAVCGQAAGAVRDASDPSDPSAAARARCSAWAAPRCRPRSSVSRAATARSPPSPISGTLTC